MTGPIGSLSPELTQTRARTRSSVENAQLIVSQDSASDLEERHRREVETLRSIAAQAQKDLQAVRDRERRRESDRKAAVSAQVVNQLIPAIDDFERFQRSGGVRPLEAISDDPFGISLLFQRLLTVLGEFGVEPFDPEGQEFDPHRHEALQVIEGNPNTPLGTVVRTVNLGYTLEGKIVRPARVLVTGGAT